MLPRWHIVLGAIFSLVLYLLFPSISLINISMTFLASVFIDIDHYLGAVQATGKISLFSAFAFYKERERITTAEKKRGIRKRDVFQPLHTVEVHLLVLVIGLYFQPFLYILYGMLFHSMLDIISMSHSDTLYMREFLLVKWLATKLR